MDRDLRARLDRIRARLARLRELDPPQPEGSNLIDRDGKRLDGYIMFGAASHAYRHWLIDEEHLRTLESAMGCTLPAEFRAFLSEIGVGAGPYYGIDWEYLRRGATAKCAEPFPEGDSGPYYLDEDGDEEVESGYLEITQMGCGDDVGLVVTGPARGRVVWVLRTNDVWELGPPFLDYYEQWIERGIGRLEAGERPFQIV
ncbi:MAG: SMI1/KNR4 family protein [Catenulispora sp.]|nr:SMI1/KNR4 family protein [Catenulispora sp.]